MAHNVGPLLQTIPSCYTESEAADAKLMIKRRRPDIQDSSEFSEYLRKLYESGDIDFQDGDTELLEMLAEKTSKKDEVLELIKDFKSQVPRQEKIVGREKDMEKIHKFLSDVRVPGVNLFGESGVGKTTLAKEVFKGMKGFVTLSIDLRGTQDIKSVYFEVLGAFNLPKSDYSKERIYTHLENLTSKTLLLLDNVEQFLSKGSEADHESRKNFLEFLKTVIKSNACKNGDLKVLLTSRIIIDEPAFRHALFVEYHLQPFSKKDSKDFISRRVKDEDSDKMQDEAAIKISDRYCNDMIYLLRIAEQLKRFEHSTSVEVLQKITAQIEKRVPEQFACINALFESIPSEPLKQVATKISLLQRPFSVSTAMKIIEMSSDYYARWDLEVLVAKKIITAKDVHGERKYDVHDRFREFVTSYLCKEEPIYQEYFNRGKEMFAENFSDELVKLSEKLESDFVGTFSKLEENRPNFERTIDIIIENASFDLLFYSDDLKKAGLISLFFKYVVNNQKRKELFKSWSENSEKKGNFLISAYIKCWEALLSADIEGTSRGFETLKQATLLLDGVDRRTTNQTLFDMAQGMYLFCRGHLKYQQSGNLTDQSSSKTKKMTKILLNEALDDLEKSLVIHQNIYGDHSLTARSLDLMGNCYMLQFEPEKAESFYQDAMTMKLKLIGSEKHDDIVHYYNQLSQVHQMMGDNIMKGPFDLKKVMGPLLPYQKKAKKQYEMAANLLEIALNLQENLGVNDTEDTATFQRNLANIYIVLKRYDKALEYAEKSFKTRYCLLKEHPETVRIQYLIGIIHEWRKDLKAALQSYEQAFEMEESLPEDNHSVVRKLLCDRLEVMCKKLNEKVKLKNYRPRIKAIMQIKSSQPVTEEPAAQVVPTTARRDDNLEAAEEVTEEEVHDHPVHGDIPEETPLSYTEPGMADTEPLIQEDQPDFPLPPDHTPITPTEPGTADTEHFVQEDLDDVPLPPDDTPATPTEQGMADTEPLIQVEQPDVPLPPEETPTTLIEPGTADAVHPVQEDISIQNNTINPEGGIVDIPTIGTRLYIPLNTVTQATVIMFKNYTVESLPVTFPAGKGEAVVSYIVGLEPSTVELNKPIFVSLMHSGLGKGYGYETIVRAFNHDNETWEEPKVLDHIQVDISTHCRKDYVVVQISKLTILAVVTRLITDRFQVTPKGCVVRSSVCGDVTVEFPEGAVDRTVEGTMKLLPMPENIYKLYNVYACPMLFMKGFENVELLKSVTIQMPHPCRTKCSASQAKLVRLKNNEWQEIEDPLINVEDAYMKFQIQHFCWLWLMIPVGGIVAVAVASAFKIYEYLKTPPQAAFIAASRGAELRPRQLKLHCLANHKQDEFRGTDMVLCASTVDELRPGEKAHTRIEGSFESKEKIYVKFLKNQEPFSRLLTLQRKQQNTGTEEFVRLLFYKEESEESPLVEFSIEEDMIDPKGQTSEISRMDPDVISTEVLDKRLKDLEQKQESLSCEKRIEKVEKEEPVECFGVLITEPEFKDLPEDIIQHMIFEDKIPGKENGQWKPEKFLRDFSKDKPRSKCLQHLMDLLQENFPVAMSHIIDLLSIGKELVTTPLKENQELKEKTIEIISTNPNCCWKTLAGHLKVDEEIVKRYKEDYSGDEQQETTRQMLEEWIEKSDKRCTLDNIFEALRLCGYKDIGEKVATHTTVKCRAKLKR